MGDSLLALRAGVTPKIIPTRKETPKARMTEPGVTLAGKKLLIPRVPRDPRIIPMSPPRPDKIMASNKN